MWNKMNSALEYIRTDVDGQLIPIYVLVVGILIWVW